MNRREFLRLSALGMADSLNPRLDIGDIVVAFYLKFWFEISINSCWSIGRILPSSIDTLNGCIHRSRRKNSIKKFFFSSVNFWSPDLYI